MQLQQKLSHDYLKAVYLLPPELRVRRPLEESVIQKLESGRNVCIRGFWRIGKTELMKAALGGACRKLRASGLFFDLRSDRNEDSLPKSREEVLAKITERLRDFYGNLGLDGISIDPQSPLISLEKIGKTVFVGIDELIALQFLGKETMTEILRQIRGAPANVRLVLVCHRNFSVDEIFQSELMDGGRFDTVFVPPITDAELEHIVRMPALGYGVAVTDDALERLASLSGNKPWETFTFCYMAARMLERLGSTELDGDLLDEVVTMENLLKDEHGRWVIDNYARILLCAMTQEEKEIVMKLASGNFSEGEMNEKTLKTLETDGWIKKDGLWQVNSTLFRDFVAAVVSGAIGVQHDG